MPVYLFSYHANGACLPDGGDRFVLQRQAAAPRRLSLMERYRLALEEQEVVFDADHQRKLIDAVIDGQQRCPYLCLGAGADESRVHAVVVWTTPETPVDIRASIKSALGREMNREFGRRAWLGEGGADRRVRNRAQLDYLLETYLPKEARLAWTRQRGFVDRQLFGDRLRAGAGRLPVSTPGRRSRAAG